MTVMDFPTTPLDGQTTADGRYYFDASVGTSGAWRSAPLPVGGLPAGSIIQWGATTPPANWLLCDGSAVSRVTYSSLFAAIGTTYGVGNGSTTFNLPDLRGRVAVGRDGSQTEFDVLGESGGAKTHTLTVDQIPSHNHTGGFTQTWAISGGQVGGGRGNDSAVHPNPLTGATGGGQAHNNLQPYLVTNYIIKATAGWTAGDSELATRLGAVEQRALSGLVPIVPSAVAFVSGSGSITSTGKITFSGCSVLDIDGVFSSKYTNYRIVYRGTASAHGSPAYWRGRTTTVDSSTNYYVGGVATNVATNAISGYSNAGATIGSIGNSSLDSSQRIMDITAPNLPERTQWAFTTMGYTGTAYHGIVGNGLLFTTTQYTGLQFGQTSGTFSGSMSIYGYAE